MKARYRCDRSGNVVAVPLDEVEREEEREAAQRDRRRVRSVDVAAALEVRVAAAEQGTGVYL